MNGKQEFSLGLRQERGLEKRTGLPSFASPYSEY
jgi:hypothetical protein